MAEVQNQATLFPILDITGGAVRPEPGPDDVEIAGRPLRRKYLINRLNHLNFCEETVEFCFVHRDLGIERLRRAIPEVCRGERCDFRWSGAAPAEVPNAEYVLRSVRISNQEEIVLIYPEEYTLGRSGISVLLPRSAIIVESSSEYLENATGITAVLMQSGVRLEGELIGFTHQELKISCAAGEDLRWIDGTRDVFVHLMRDDRSVYSESCFIEEVSYVNGRRCFRLMIPRESVRRYPTRQYRSQRRELQTSPRCFFTHPLSGRTIERRIADLSGSGFSFREDAPASRLPVGMIIHDLSISFAELSTIRLKAQVIQRREEEGAEVHYGLCILDIDPQDHLSLLSLVHQAYNNYSSLCKRVDLERLWQFFFESGFIYPEKYALLQQHKTEIRRCFQRLYNERNDVARHFIYQREDRIQGHLSMVRFYERTWLLHHHASSSQKSENAGIHVLNQVGSYVNDSCRFDRMNLDFLTCFYREKNRFPKQVFGGLEKFVGDPKVCSTDEMAYCPIRTGVEGLSGDSLWSLGPATDEDFLQLNQYYETISGGLLLEAMHLPPYADREHSNLTVQKAYSDLGIIREIDFKVLRHNERTAAVFVVNRSDPGINLSELTNSVILFVIKPELLSSTIIARAAGEVAADSPGSYTPMLVFPQESADKLDIEYSKSYTAWVMDTAIGDRYFEHIQSLLRTVQS